VSSRSNDVTQVVVAAEKSASFNLGRKERCTSNCKRLSSKEREGERKRIDEANDRG